MRERCPCAVVPPPYPKEDWKTYNVEQVDLRDKMYIEWEQRKQKEAVEEEDKRKAAEEEAVNDQYCLYSCALLLPHVVPRRSSAPAGAAGCPLERVRGGVESVS